MLKADADLFANVCQDSPQGQSLRVVPLLGPDHDQPGYVLLDSSTTHEVHISEVSAAGSVPTLRVFNRLQKLLFLMDSQELIGAKQNRILNTDVLVPAGGELLIPVSCVEQGRWSQQTPTFAAGKAASHRVRSSKLANVHASLTSSKVHDADQSAVWQDVEASLMHSGAGESKTRALADAYARRQCEMDEFRANLRMPPDAVGLAVFHQNCFLGLDLFDRHSTLAGFWDSLIDSYAVDYLYSPESIAESLDGAPAMEIKHLLLQAQSGQWQQFNSPGEGKDWRLKQPHLSGAALVWDDSVVLHLQLLPRRENRRAVRRRSDRRIDPSSIGPDTEIERIQ